MTEDATTTSGATAGSDNAKIRTAVRTGAQFLEHLAARPRDVWVLGEKVGDVTKHPAFEGSARQLAHLYDMQHDPDFQDVLTYVDEERGVRVGTAFMPSYSTEDLVKRRKAFQAWAEATFGLMGRSPDFMNTTLLAFTEARDLFAEDGEEYAENVVNYYHFVRDNDLFLSHALVTPQNDRSQTSGKQADKSMHLRVVKERDDGIVVSGARMLATLGPVSDEMIMYNLPIFVEGVDEDHAISFAVPTDVEGMRQICRTPYDIGGRSSFDYPLSSRFEESDALLIFKDVFVPWERVFVYRNVSLCNRLYPQSALRNHTAHQTNVRALVKMRFCVGLAIAVARAIKADSFLHVQEMLGSCLMDIELIESGIVRAEVEHEQTPAGTVRTGLLPLQALRTFMSTAYPRAVEVLQKIGAGGLMMMPSGADLDVGELADDIAQYYQGAGGMPSEDRIRLFKVAWDLAGEAFGSRQLQYERYYAGDPVRLKAMNYTTCDATDMQRLVDAAVALTRD